MIIIPIYSNISLRYTVTWQRFIDELQYDFSQLPLKTPSERYNIMLRDRLKKYNAKLIFHKGSSMIQFDDEEYASFFVLKYGG